MTKVCSYERSGMTEDGENVEGCDDCQQMGESGSRLQLSDLTSRRRMLLGAVATGGTLSLSGCLSLYSFGVSPEEWSDERGIEADQGDEVDEPTDEDDTDAEDGDPVDGEGDGVETYEVRYLKQEKTLNVPAGQSLLEAGEEQGWNLPYQCRRGICGTCTARLWGNAHERVVMEDPEDPTRRNQFLTDEEIKDGFTLTCVGYARSEFTLETGERDALDR